MGTPRITGCMREFVRCFMLVEVELSGMPQTALQVQHRTACEASFFFHWVSLTDPRLHDKEQHGIAITAKQITLQQAHGTAQREITRCRP